MALPVVSLLAITNGLELTLALECSLVRPVEFDFALALVFAVFCLRRRAFGRVLDVRQPEAVAA